MTIYALLVCIKPYNNKCNNNNNFGRKNKKELIWLNTERIIYKLEYESGA